MAPFTGESLPVVRMPQRDCDALMHARELNIADSNPETKLHIVDALRVEDTPLR